MADIEKFGQVNKPMLPVVVFGTRGWDAIEAAEKGLEKHGIEPTRRVCTLDGKDGAAKVLEKVREVEAEQARQAKSQEVKP